MSATTELLDRAGHALKEAFSDFVIVGVPIDTAAEPVLVQFGKPNNIKAAVRIAEERINGSSHRKRYRRKAGTKS